MEVFMIIILSIVGVILLVANVYLLAYYSHPDDGGFGAGIFAKIVLVLSMTLTWATVLMFPLDVSNSRSDNTVPFRMDVFWMIIYICTGVFVLIIIPGCIYYYESDPDWSCVS
jgi:hypothetical protein